MSEYGKKIYKSYFPDSMLSKMKILYRKTNRNLITFLKNNFSSDYSNSKFPIKKPTLLKKNSTIKRKNSIIIKERPKSSQKHNLRTLLENLCHENYKSYNFYNNTKGPLLSTKHKNKNKLILKGKIYNDKENTFSNNDSNTNNINLLSTDSRPTSPKAKFYHSNSSLYIISQKKVKRRVKDIDFKKNSNLNSFSFSGYTLSKRNNISKNKSIPQTPTSTRYKSNQQNSLKLEYDSLSLNNSTKKSRNKSTFSMKSNNRNKKNCENKKIDENHLSNKKINRSQIMYEKDQREFHQKLYLNNLYSQIKLFEVSNGFDVNEAQIKSNLISPSKFQRNLFIKEIKRASNHNDYFFKKIPFKSKNKKDKQKYRIHSPKQRLYDNKSKNLIKNINRLKKKSNISKHLIKSLDVKSGADNLKSLIDLIVPVKHEVKDSDEQFKDETVNYQKNIGKFFFYKGCGIYSGHLSSILRGDKIMKETIKFNNL